MAQIYRQLHVKEKGVRELGERLVELGIDSAHTGGFWLLSVDGSGELLDEWYSPRFRKTLGYKNEQDFPNDPASWQKAIFPEDKDKAMKAYAAHYENPENNYFLIVRYYKKNGDVVPIICAGEMMDRNSDNPIMIGIHEIDI